MAPARTHDVVRKNVPAWGLELRLRHSVPPYEPSLADTAGALRLVNSLVGIAMWGAQEWAKLPPHDVHVEGWAELDASFG